MTFGKRVAKRTKIALVGTSESWRDAPYDDLSWDIWTFNRAGLSLERWDRLFEIHRDWYYDGQGEAYLDELRAVRLPKQVISTVRLFDDPANVVLDREAFFARWSPFWLSSSIAWAFAIALEEKPEEIGLWGIDMESFEEHVVQFGGVRHFIDIAKERGIRVTIAPRSSLLRNPPPYPDRFETTLALFLETKAKYLQRRVQKQEHRVRAALKALGVASARFSLDDDLGNTKQSYDYDDASGSAGDFRDAEAVLYEHERALHLLKGQLWATQVYRRLFVWNAELPAIGDTRDFDLEEVGPY